MDSPVVEKTGGVAYELILKLANKENSPARASPATPRCHKLLVSSASIEKKLNEAKERRTMLEKTRQESWLKEKAKIEEANQRVQQFNDSFVKETEKKLMVKMETQQEKKDAHTRALLTRLHAHAKRVDEVRGLSDSYSTELKARVDRAMEEHGDKREAQLASIQDRLRQHKKHVDEVLENGSRFSKQTKEKMVVKMEKNLKNKEGQLEKLMNRVREHNSRASRVLMNKTNNPDDSISAANLSSLAI